MPFLSTSGHVQQYVHDVLEGEGHYRHFAAPIRWFLIGLILLNILAFLLETVEPLSLRYARVFDLVLYISIALFSLIL